MAQSYRAWNLASQFSCCPRLSLCSLCPLWLIPSAIEMLAGGGSPALPPRVEEDDIRQIALHREAQRAEAGIEFEAPEIGGEVVRALIARRGEERNDAGEGPMCRLRPEGAEREEVRVHITGGILQLRR